jgi:NAD(P)-dependent dehydrogenase (short-subunit alcohol dehydrogenase family)
VGATHVGVRVPPDLLAVIDAWIEERRESIAAPVDLSRPEAIRQLVVEALQKMGRYPVR